jgi:FSR family fosmidomycin resistance protein-like MFS transporter
MKKIVKNISKISNNLISSNLAVYATAHLLTDLICAAMLFSAYISKVLPIQELAYLFVAYNILAFGLQLPFGYISDKVKKPKEFASIGLLLTSLAALLGPINIFVAVLLAGSGNALFHIGAGTIALNLTPKKATAPGIFVAPGALGLLIGTLLAKAGMFNPITFFGATVLLFGAIYETKLPKINYIALKENKSNMLELFVILLLIVICARSIVGYAFVFPWKTDLTLLVVLTLGVVFGKALGGILGDKFGWIKIGVGGLLVSIPLLYFGPQYFVFGIIGMFLFNFTMPITLTAISNLLPGRPGIAFGLTCMALIIGALPFYTEISPILKNNLLGAIIIFVSAILLYFVLKRTGNNSN